MPFRRNRGSRVFHLMMILPAGLLLVLSLVALSTLAVTNERFLDEYEEKEPSGDSRCILYAEKGDGTVRFRGGGTCNFGVLGAAIMGGFAIAFTIILVVKALFGVHVVSCSVVIELALSTIGALWAFSVSVVITVGLEQTCRAYTDTFPDIDSSSPCCSFFYRHEDDDSSNVYFYEGINTSRITAWFAMGVLMFLSGVYLCILLRYCCGGRKAATKSSAQPEVELQEKMEPNPI